MFVCMYMCKSYVLYCVFFDSLVYLTVTICCTLHTLHAVFSGCFIFVVYRGWGTLDSDEADAEDIDVTTPEVFLLVCNGTYLSHEKLAKCLIE